MKYLYFLFLFMCNLTYSQDFWVNYSVKYQINRKSLVKLNLQTRSEFNGGLKQIRCPQIEYSSRLTDELRMGVSVLNTINKDTYNEIRLSLRVFYTFSINSTSIVNRFQLDYQNFYGQGFYMTYRPRYRFTVKKPLHVNNEYGIYLTFSEEIYLRVSNFRITQNRLSLGFLQEFNDRVSFEFMYLNRFNRDQREYSHVFNTRIGLKIYKNN